MKVKLMKAGLVAAMAAAAWVTCGADDGARRMWLDGQDLGQMTSGWDRPKKNLSVTGKPITIGGKTFAHGVGTHATSRMVFKLEGAFERFEADVGVDGDIVPDMYANNPDKTNHSSVRFLVFLDDPDTPAASSPVLRFGDAPYRLAVDLKGAKRIELLVSDADDGQNWDHADWADAVFTASPGAKLVPAGEVNDWENLAVNSLNRLPAATYAPPLASVKDALADRLVPETPYVKSLNGIWKISWAGRPQDRVRKFWAADFDDSAWCTIDVPSCVEMRGFGSPGYTNANYPHANAWPRILDRDTNQPNYNPVSSYRTRFTVPAGWKGRDVILRFDGVYSAYYVWVNGEKVGYAEDSKLPSEFDVTAFLKDGENVLAVEVYRWCDGSYLEDQDMFRYSGIFRDVTLWARPKDGIRDFSVKTVPEAGYAKWRLDLAAEGVETATLYDAAGKAAGELRPLVGANMTGRWGAYFLDLEPLVWSAEKPNLYTLVMTGRGGDIRAVKVGFKEQKVVGNTFYVNGKPVKLKGVNRHECSPENGRTVSTEEMLRDIVLMKTHNIDTVRTCHYPDHHLWYDLCDRYGLYVIAEANVEGHEPGFGEKGLGRFPEFDHTIVERNVRHVLTYRNHPSVTLWSMGNETGHGDCFEHAIAHVKRLDPTRPVHWERGNMSADVDSAMYPSVKWLEERGAIGDAPAGGEGMPYGEEPKARQSSGKPFVMCEYAHAMGNAVGNLQEYWDVIYAHPSLFGGCIWDWIDQAVWKETGEIDPATGKAERYLAYGGDFDETPNDGSFCVNGVIGPLREVTPKLLEVAHVYRNLLVTRNADGSFVLENRYAFTRADEFAGRWALRADGEVVAEGTFDVPPVEPLSRGTFSLQLPSAPEGKELFLDVGFVRKGMTAAERDRWPAEIVSQVELSRVGAKAAAKPAAAGKVAFAEDDKTVTVAFGGSKAVFCRRSGTLCRLETDGVKVLEDPAPGVVCGPRLTCERAFTDNDGWMRGGVAWASGNRPYFYTSGLTQLRYHAEPKIVLGADTLTVVTHVTGSRSAGFVHEQKWTFRSDGTATLANMVTPVGVQPAQLPRLGLSLRLDGALERMTWYGRGPHENYIDRKESAFMGVWRSTVTGQFVDYVRPQDNGYKCDVRWVAFTDGQGRGVKFSASEPLFVQALHHSLEDLEFARHRCGERRIRVPLAARADTYLNLDVRQCGLGGGSCGPITLDAYRFELKGPVTWTLELAPVGK